MSTVRTGSGDCERCRSGIIAQPVNVVSSLGYVVAGVSTLRGPGASRPIEQVVAWSAIVAGIGSVAFHGPGGRASKLVHDGGLIALLGSTCVADLTDLAGVDLGWGGAGLVGAAALGIAATRWDDSAQVIAGIGAVLGEAFRIANQSGPTSIEDRLLAPITLSGAAAHVLGRTGGPLCAPDSLIQPHAIWHLATASTVWLRGRSIARRRRPTSEPSPTVREHR